MVTRAAACRHGGVALFVLAMMALLTLWLLRPLCKDVEVRAKRSLKQSLFAMRCAHPVVSLEVLLC